MLQFQKNEKANYAEMTIMDEADLASNKSVTRWNENKNKNRTLRSETFWMISYTIKYKR